MTVQLHTLCVFCSSYTMSSDSCQRLCFNNKCRLSINDESMENGNGKMIWHEIESWRSTWNFIFQKYSKASGSACDLSRFIFIFPRIDMIGLDFLLLFICARCMVTWNCALINRNKQSTLRTTCWMYATNNRIVSFVRTCQTFTCICHRIDARLANTK